MTLPGILNLISMMNLLGSDRPIVNLSKTRKKTGMTANQDSQEESVAIQVHQLSAG